jgi:SAM-dependent methyltransferase
MAPGLSIRKWIRDRFSRHDWDQSLISDAWFRAHFEYAAQTIGEWLAPVIQIEDATVMDFGCGDGITALGVTLQCRPRQLVGVDITRAFSKLEILAKQQMGLLALPVELAFHQVEAGKPLAWHGLDAVYSWSVFEHVEREQLPKIAAAFFDVLRPGGIAFIQIEPLYYSAYGSHLERVLSEPWAHLRLDAGELERRVLSYEGDLPEGERDLASSEGVTPAFKKWLFGEYRALNRLTGDELVQLFTGAGFEMVREHRGQRPEEPPAELAKRFDRADLMTNEIRLLARRPS